MGDEGRIYVSDEVVPAYKTLLRDADLILPNQFEAEYVDRVQCLLNQLFQLLIPQQASLGDQDHFFRKPE